MSRREEFENWTDGRPETFVAEVRARVGRGMTLLDERVPGWIDRIDLDELYLSSAERCVLGQLFDEPRAIPIWQVEGFPSLEHALAKAETYYPGDPDGQEWWRGRLTQLSCMANYDAGVAVLGLNADDDGLDLDDSELQAFYGFDDGYADTNTFVKYSDLDAVWHEAIVLRRQQLTA